ALAESQLPLDYRIDSPARRVGIMTRIGLRWEALRRTGRLRSRLANSTLRASFDVAANRDLINPSSSDSEAASVRVATAASVCLQQADSGRQRRVKPSGRDSE